MSVGGQEAAAADSAARNAQQRVRQALAPLKDYDRQDGYVAHSSQAGMAQVQGQVAVAEALLAVCAELRAWRVTAMAALEPELTTAAPGEGA